MRKIFFASVMMLGMQSISATSGMLNFTVTQNSVKNLCPACHQILEAETIAFMNAKIQSIKRNAPWVVGGIIGLAVASVMCVYWLNRANKIQQTCGETLKEENA